MKIEEIMTTPPRDEYLDGYSEDANQAKIVAKIRDLVLKKTASSGEIIYFLVDKQNRLVGVFHLQLEGDYWQVRLVQLANAFKGMGYGTFLYDYAVMNDKLTIVSDGTNTGGPHGSRQMWERLWKNARYSVRGIDLDSGQIFDADPDMIYDSNNYNIRWILFPGDKTINEAIDNIQKKMKSRYLVWYGPGTTQEGYFNY